MSCSHCRFFPGGWAPALEPCYFPHTLGAQLSWVHVTGTFLGEIQPGGALATQVCRRSIVWCQGGSLVRWVLGLQVLPVIGGGSGSFWVVCLLAPVPL